MNDLVPGYIRWQVEDVLEGANGVLLMKWTEYANKWDDRLARVFGEKVDEPA
jgi:hypothetical protein